jgi:hypothetical protein
MGTLWHRVWLDRADRRRPSRPGSIAKPIGWIGLTVADRAAPVHCQPIGRTRNSCFVI